MLSELELDFDLEVIGFETAEIDVLIDGLETINEPDPDDRLPAIETSAVSVTGDLWQLGKHRVLCGNSLILENYDRLMDGAKADLVITDPPYNGVIDGHASGLGKARHREFAMASGEMSAGEFTEFLGKAMALSRLSSQPGSLAYYFMDWRHLRQISGHLPSTRLVLALQQQELEKGAEQQRFANRPIRELTDEELTAIILAGHPELEKPTPDGADSR